MEIFGLACLAAVNPKGARRGPDLDVRSSACCWRPASKASTGVQALGVVGSVVIEFTLVIIPADAAQRHQRCDQPGSPGPALAMSRAGGRILRVRTGACHHPAG